MAQNAAQALIAPPLVLKTYVAARVNVLPGVAGTRIIHYRRFLSATLPGRILYPTNPALLNDPAAQDTITRACAMHMSFCVIMLEVDLNGGAHGAVAPYAPLEDPAAVPSPSPVVTQVLRDFLAWWRACNATQRRVFLADVGVKAVFLTRSMIERAMVRLHMPAFTQPNDKSGKLATFMCALSSQRPAPQAIHAAMQGDAGLRIIVDLFAKYVLLGVGLQEGFWISAFQATNSHGAKDSIVVVRVVPPHGVALRPFVVRGERFCDNGLDHFVFNKTWEQVDALLEVYAPHRVELRMLKGFLRGEALPTWAETRHFVDAFDVGQPKVQALHLQPFYNNDKEGLTRWLYYLILMSDSGGIKLWSRDKTAAVGVLGNALGAMRHYSFWAAHGYFPGRRPALGNFAEADQLSDQRRLAAPQPPDFAVATMSGHLCACSSFRCIHLLQLRDAAILDIDQVLVEAELAGQVAALAAAHAHAHAAAQAAAQVGAPPAAHAAAQAAVQVAAQIRPPSHARSSRFLVYGIIAKRRGGELRRKLDDCVSLAIRMWYPGGNLTGFIPSNAGEVDAGSGTDSDDIDASDASHDESSVE